MSDKVTPDMIDQRLVRNIYGDSPRDPSLWNAIENTLAWLANNPIEPTDKQAREIGSWWKGNPNPMHVSEMAVQFQRVAYLKKEDPLPQELKELKDKWYQYALGAEAFTDMVKAYKIGKGEL